MVRRRENEERKKNYTKVEEKRPTQEFTAREESSATGGR